MTEYATIKVYTSERARYEGRPLAQAVVAHVRSLHLAARCVVYRGIEGLYESGETATNRLAEVANDLPLVVEILLPAAEADALVSRLETMVTDGMVSVFRAQVSSFRSPSSVIPPHLLVRDVMTARPVDAHPGFSVRVAVELLLDEGLKCLPVVDDRTKLVGILTQRDLVERAGMPVRLGLLRARPSGELDAWLARSERRTVAEAMTPKPASIREDRKLAEAVRLMLRRNLKRLPVLDAEDRLCGMLSRIDVLKALAAATPGSGSPVGGSRADGAAEAPRLVRDLEVRDGLALEAETPLRTAMDRMATAKAQRAAVVDADGRLVGLVTDTLLLAAVREGSGGFGPFRSLAARRAERKRVADLMLRDLVTVEEDTSVEEAIRLMTERGLKRIPVVDEGRRFRGMIRRDSVLVALSRHL